MAAAGMDEAREQALSVRVRRAAEVVEALQTVAEAGDVGGGGRGVERAGGRGGEPRAGAATRVVCVASKVAGVLAPWLGAEAGASRGIQEAVQRLVLPRALFPALSSPSAATTHEPI